MYLNEITTEKTLCHSKAFLFVMQEFAQLLTNGHAESELPFANQSQVTYGLDDKRTVIAASVHRFDATKRVMWIQFSAVAAEHRGQGAYREIFADLLRQARQLGAAEIYSGVAVGNDAMHAVAGHLNRQPVVMRYRYPVSSEG